MRDFSVDLSIIVTGSGNTNEANLRENLEDWIFGNGDGREVEIIIPLQEKLNAGMRTFISWAVNVGADILVIKGKGFPMTKELTALSADQFVEALDERDALAKAFKYLEAQGEKGNEVAFMQLFNPESVYSQGSLLMSDLEILCEAKEQTGLLTLNLSEGLQDAFEGYESAEDRENRLAKEAEYKAEQDRLNALAIESGVVPKKATAPRKRAAKKPVEPEPTQTPAEPEKAPQTSSEDKLKALVDKRVALENEKRAERLASVTPTLSATASMGPKVLHEIVGEAGKVPTLDSLLGSNVVSGIEKEEADYHFSMNVVENRSPWDSSRDDVLLLELAENVAAMGKAFTDTISTLTKMIKERNV